MAKGPLAWYTEVLKDRVGFWWVYVISLGACIWGIKLNNERRLLNIIIITWFIPLSMYLIIFIAKKDAQYIWPTLLPLMGCIANPALWNISQRRPKQIMTVASAIIALSLIGFQLVIYIRADIRSYLLTLHREQNSLSIAFYRQLDTIYLQQLPQGARISVFRDPIVYLPPLNNVDVRMKWGTTDYSDINSINPDLILLQRDYITENSDPSVISVSIDPEQAKKSLIFYRDAKNNTIKGYHKILETPFGIAFEKNK
jgi:hypothetical protein